MKIVDLVVNIVKDKPLKTIVDSTLIKLIHSDVFQNSLHSAIHLDSSTTTSTATRKLELVEHMQKMVNAVVSIIRGDPLTKLVNSVVVKVISSDHFQLSLSGSIESKVENLLRLL